MEAVDLSLLETVFQREQGNVPYVWGAKPAPMADSHDVTGSDCSGWVRHIIARATNGAVILPEGSMDQAEWFARDGLHKLVQYKDVVYGANDPSRLFVAHFPPVGGDAGHIWLVRAGMTRECCGGKGVSSRAWNTKVLLKATEAWELPTKRRA